MVDLQAALGALVVEAWGSNEIMDVKVKGLLPSLASPNISVPPL